MLLPLFKMVPTSQNTPQFYFRNQHLLVFQAYCKNPHVLNLFYCQVIEPQSSIIRPSFGDKSCRRYLPDYVTSTFRSHPRKLAEVPNIHVLNQKNLGGGPFFFPSFFRRGMSEGPEKPWFEHFSW